MRLTNATSWVLEEFAEDKVPPYAIRLIAAATPARSCASPACKPIRDESRVSRHQRGRGKHATLS